MQGAEPSIRQFPLSFLSCSLFCQFPPPIHPPQLEKEHPQSSLLLSPQLGPSPPPRTPSLSLLYGLFFPPPAVQQEPSSLRRRRAPCPHSGSGGGGWGVLLRDSRGRRVAPQHLFERGEERRQGGEGGRGPAD